MGFFQDRDKLPLKQVNLTVTGTNWTTSRAVGVVYKTLNGAYRISFNIYGTVSVSTDSITLTVSGVTFLFTQAVAYSDGLATSDIQLQQTGAGNGQIALESTGSGTERRVSGDVELASKPSFLEV